MYSSPSNLGRIEDMEQATQESKTERVTLACTPTERRALETIFAARSEDYDGASSVLRDYSLSDAVNKAIEIKQRFNALGKP